MPTTQPTPLSEDEIVLLSREIQAMMAAGVPLDFGLESCAGGFSERMEDVSLRLADQLRGGASLPAALDAETAIPGVYKAVLVAGLQCGRSDEVLDDVCQLTTSLLDLRASIRRGLIYPLFVVGLSVLFMVLVFPRYLLAQIQLREELGVTVPEWVQPIRDFTTLAAENGPVLIAVILGLLVCWMLLKWVSGSLQNTSSSLRWIPGASSLWRRIDLARTTNILALLTKYECPLPLALKLTAQTTQYESRRTQFEQMSQDVESGQTLLHSMQQQAEFPPFLCWLISQGAESSELSTSLSQAAEFYRSQASNRARFVQVVVPSAALVLVGGSVTLMYGLMVFGPMIGMWEAMAQP